MKITNRVIVEGSGSSEVKRLWNDVESYKIPPDGRIEFVEGDPHYDRLISFLKEHSSKFRIHWQIVRDVKYTKKDFLSMELLDLEPISGVDETDGDISENFIFERCPKCNVVLKRTQKDDLYLSREITAVVDVCDPLFSRKVNFSIILGDFLVISQKVADIIIQENLTGFSLRNVRFENKKFPKYYQLEVTSKPLEITFPSPRHEGKLCTECGQYEITRVDRDTLPEENIVIHRSSYDGSDICQYKFNRGLESIFFISPKFYNALSVNRIRGVVIFPARISENR